jgi:hypothetical protein
MNQMNSLRMLLMSVFVSSSLSVWATDDIAIEQFETDVSMAKSKASQNSQDIQNLKGGLPAEAAARIAADELLHQKINEIELTPGPPGPKGDTGDSGILAVAGTSCGAGEVLTGFDASGAIICSEINGSGPGIVGADCVTFRENWLNLGNLQIQPGLDLRGCDLRGLSVTAFNFESTNGDLYQFALMPPSA